jgi:hypothetical protein
MHKRGQKLFKLLTMAALIIGVCKALTVLTMKHCRKTTDRTSFDIVRLSVDTQS